MRFVLVAAAIWLVVCSGASLAAEEPGDVPSIEGAWQVKQSELGGQELPPETFRDMVLVLQAGRYKVTGKRPDEGTYQTDARTNPPTIDVTGAAGPSKGVTMLAIYELTGDVLRVCYDLSGKGRPTEFKTDGEPQFLLMAYERQKQP